MTDESTISIPKLRDIRDDLRARIRLLESQLAGETAAFEVEQKALLDKFRSKIEEIKVSISGYNRLLEIENRRVHSVEGTDPAGQRPPAGPRTPLADFLMAEMASRGGGKTKDELREIAQAAGYFAPGDGGRAIHATIINLVRNNRVRELPDGKYAVPMSAAQQRDLLERRA